MAEYTIEMLRTWKTRDLETSYMHAYNQAITSPDAVKDLDMFTDALSKRSTTEIMKVRNNLVKLVEIAEKCNSAKLARSASGMLDYFDYKVKG